MNKKANLLTVVGVVAVLFIAGFAFLNGASITGQFHNSGHNPQQNQQCIQNCNGQLNTCNAAADAFYTAQINQCNTITDPAQRRQCLKNAAQTYASLLQSCSNQHNTCVQAC